MSPISRTLLICLACVVVVAVAPLCTTAPFDGATTRIRWSSGLASLSFETRGSVEFTDDDRDVKSISPGGRLSIKQGSWLQTDRSYEVRADSSGSLSRIYKVGGRVRTMDADGQAWAAGALLSLIRESGVGAGLRVERLLKAGGPPAVLREVQEIRSDGSKRIYLRELVERGSLDADQLRDVMRSARSIGSDGDKTGLLIEVSPNYRASGLRQSWFTTLNGVGSDGDKRRALDHAILSDPEVETLALTAGVAAGMGSDGDKTAVLSAIAGRGLAEGVHRPWSRAVQTIGSDGDKRHALSAVLATPVGDQEALVEILQTAQTIGSDGDKAAVLRAAAHSDLSSDAVQRAFFSAVNSIGSDSDRRSVLTSVLQASLAAGVAQSAKGIGSDGDKAAVLSRVAELDVDDPAARAAFFTAVNTIGSDGDRAAVLRNVLRRSEQTETVVAAIDSAASMGSDGDKANVLLLAAERRGSDAAVRRALEKALKSVHSDGDYRRVTGALLR